MQFFFYLAFFFFKKSPVLVVYNSKQVKMHLYVFCYKSCQCFLFSYNTAIKKKKKPKIPNIFFKLIQKMRIVTVLETASKNVKYRKLIIIIKFIFKLNY